MGRRDRQCRCRRLQRVPQRHVPRPDDRSDVPGRWLDVRDVVHVLGRGPRHGWQRLNFSSVPQRRDRRVLSSASGAKLAWAPPTLSSPITINVSNQNSLIYLDAGRYIVKMPSSPLTVSGGLSLIGGRNVVIVGGEIFRDTPISQSAGVDAAYGIALIGKPAPSTSRACGFTAEESARRDCSRTRIARATTRLSRSRTAGSRASIRSTGMSTQTRFSPMVGLECCGSIRDTLISNGVTLQTQPCDVGTSRPHDWDYRHVNLVHQTPDAYALWKNCTPWSEYHEDVWLKANPNHVASDTTSAWAGGTCWSRLNPRWSHGRSRVSRSSSDLPPAATSSRRARSAPATSHQATGRPKQPAVGGLAQHGSWLVARGSSPAACRSAVSRRYVSDSSNALGHEVTLGAPAELDRLSGDRPWTAWVPARPAAPLAHAECVDAATCAGFADSHTSSWYSDHLGPAFHKAYASGVWWTRFSLR